MSFSRMRTIRAVVALSVGLSASTLGQTQRNQAQSGTNHPATKERSRIAFSHMLPKLDGNRLKATVAEVNYRPGEASPPHSHPCAVIGYVVTGKIRTQVRGEPLEIYKAGESFYEAPNGIHLVSGNASMTQPARLLAYFVCDRDAPLSTAESKITHAGGK